MRRSFSSMVVAALVAFAIVPPALADGDKPGHEKDIVDTAVRAGSFKTLAAALTAADLVETLKGRGPFTVFAPTDKAFEKLPKGTLQELLKPENRDRLRAILTYHVVQGRTSARDAFSLTNASTVNGQRIDITRRNGRLLVDQARIITTDIQCSNGVIHVIDRVLLPEENRIPTVSEKAGKFKTLLAAVQTADLAEALNSEGPLTVFAPTDAAFRKLPRGTIETLLKPENRQELIDILKFHVVSGRVYADQAVDAGQAKTLRGTSVRFSVSAKGLEVNDAVVVQADLEAANGVIHVIDSVLIPEPMTPREAMQTLEDAIRRGVPVFNHGDHKACAEIYAAACRMVVDSRSDHVPADVMTGLKSTVDRAKHIHHATARAWALRHGMDRALAGLRMMSLSNVTADDR